MTEADEQLIERIREILSRRKGYSEKKMFGGICFMINGNMCVGPWKGSLIVRLDREKHEETQSEPHVKPMDVTGKVMRGWALVKPAGIKSDDDLKAWIDRGVQVRPVAARQMTIELDSKSPDFRCVDFWCVFFRVRASMS